MNNGELIMELTDTMVKVVKETFNIEIEMMQGTIEKLSDGRTRYTLQIDSEEKGEMIKQFILSVMFKDQSLNHN
jgi:hypothetical protein